MTSIRNGWSRAALAYAGASAVGLGAVAYCIGRSIGSDSGPFIHALFGNWTSTVILVDLLIAAGVTIVWALSEAKRIGMNWIVWLVVMATTPFAFSLPLFLAMRERMRAGGPHVNA